MPGTQGGGTYRPGARLNGGEMLILAGRARSFSGVGWGVSSTVEASEARRTRRAAVAPPNEPGRGLWMDGV